MLITLTLAACLVPVPLAAPAPTAPTKEQIARWIQQLGDNQFDVREEASRKLWQAGQAAEESLQAAAKSEDAEVKRRAEELLEKFRLGIYPDTPKEVAEMVSRYQTADQNGKAPIVKELFGAGMPGCRCLLRILALETDDNVKRQVQAMINEELPRSIPLLLAEKNYPTLETLVELGLKAELKASVSNYTAFWLLRGKLDDRIAHHKTLEAKKGDDAKRNAEILAHLYRASGDLAAARAAAQRADRPDLLENLLYESGEWKELAKLTNPFDTGKEIERLGFRLAYHRLAGNAKELDETVDQVRKFVENLKLPDEEEQLFYAAKALFLNHRTREGMEILGRGGHLATLFELLAAQFKFREAFDLVDKARKDGSKELPALEILQARTLYGLGEKDKALPLFARQAAQIKEGNDLSWSETLVDSEFRVGLKEQALEHCAKILEISPDQGWPRRLFEKVFPNKADVADVWWTFLRQHQPGQATGVTLKQIGRVLEGKLEARDLTTLLEAAEGQIKNLAPDQADRWWLALAEAALAARQDEQAHALLEKAGTPGALLKLGDLLADKKQWERAAQRYYQAWDKDRQHGPERDRPLALPLYLSGRALVQAGQEKAGKERMEMAHWLPLGNEVIRHQFITALSQRRLTQPARRENELQLRVSEPGSYYAGEAVRRQALEALHNKDYLRAAEGHERAMLRVLRTYITFIQKAAYLGVPSMIARQRASGLVAAGKFAEGLQEATRCQEAMPGNIDLPILLIPELEKRGHKKEAEALFRQALEVYEKISADYPHCAWAHNSVGWLSACCKRNLDSALKHAEKAVGLAPDVPGHRDTLAEVYFQRGDKDQAVAAQKKVIELAPKRIYFRKQLKRLEAGDRNAPLPTEDEDEED